MEYWKDGKMEGWKDGTGESSNIPTFQYSTFKYSNIPKFHSFVM
jgi:hypothetical protein